MEKPSEDHNRCVKKLEGALSRNDKARRLLDSIEALGCSLPKEFFVCRPCEGATISGGFTVPNSENHGVTYQPQIIMCRAIRWQWRRKLSDTLVHELVHAYDQCRAKIEWKDCIQHACAESEHLHSVENATSFMNFTGDTQRFEGGKHNVWQDELRNRSP